MGQTMLGTIHPLLLNHSTLANHLPTHPPSPVPPSSSLSPPFLQHFFPFSLFLSFFSGIKDNLTDLINLTTQKHKIANYGRSTSIPISMRGKEIWPKILRGLDTIIAQLTRVGPDDVSTLVTLHFLRTRAYLFARDNLFAFIRNDDNECRR